MARLSQYVPGGLKLRDNGRSCKLRVSTCQLPSVTQRNFGLLECRPKDEYTLVGARIDPHKVCREQRVAYARKEAAANRVGLEASSNIATVPPDTRTQWGM